MNPPFGAKRNLNLIVRYARRELSFIVSSCHRFIV